MVAKISVPHTIRRALNYNEQKVKQGKAACIAAQNYVKDKDAMNFYEKLERLEALQALNKRASTNSIHVSLNFSPEEKVDEEKRIAIANAYMEKIGFGEQPYLVYEHFDAAHPHMHIVATAIRQDGKRINLHNIGRNQSEQARKMLEEQFCLVRAEGKAQALDESPEQLQRLLYGKATTKQGISRIVRKVMQEYNVVSIPQLNAVLKLYNIMADTGREGGWMDKKKGLLYRVLDAKGNKVGVPIKASALYGQPTRKNLEKRMQANQSLRKGKEMATKRKLDWVLHNKPNTMEDFRLALQKEKISLIIRHNDEGRIYGLTYIDQQTKIVWNGSELGKAYSAKAITEELKIQDGNIKMQQVTDQYCISTAVKQKGMPLNVQPVDNILPESSAAMQVTIPVGLRKRKRKKRNR